MKATRLAWPIAFQFRWLENEVTASWLKPGTPQPPIQSKSLTRPGWGPSPGGTGTVVRS